MGVHNYCHFYRVDMYICKYCGKECKNKNSLVQHEIRCRHNDNRIVKPKIKYCLNCNKILTKKSQSLYCCSSCAAHANNKKRTNTTKGKVIKATSSAAAIVAGIYLANFAMNKVSNLIFKNKTEERGVKGTDLFPHIDDVLASAQYIAPTSKVVQGISRIIPFALMVAGNEVGNKKAKMNSY